MVLEGSCDVRRRADGALRPHRGRGRPAVRVHRRARRAVVPRRAPGRGRRSRRRSRRRERLRPHRPRRVRRRRHRPARVAASTSASATARSPRWPGSTTTTRPRRSTPTGMIVAPGIVDAHTHYDPQITFDPYATMSCFHGVTTVVAGNCGFSVAPCKPEDREFLSGIFARVENMDPIALERDHLGRVRDVPRVPRQPRGQARRQLRLLRRPLEPAPLGDGRGRVRRAPRPTTRSTQMRGDGRRGDGRGRRRRVVVGRADPPRPRRPSGAVARRRARDELLALAEAAGHAGRGLDRVPARRARSAASTPTDEDYLIQLWAR